MKGVIKMKKLVVLFLLLGCLYCHRHNEDNNITPTPNIKIPVCKDEDIREREFLKYKNYLLSKNYEIVKSLTSETTFSVVVKDKYGQEHVETKEWCSIERGVIDNE